MQKIVGGERQDQFRSWMTGARRDYGWWSTFDDRSNRLRQKACKIRLPTRIDDDLMRYEAVDSDIGGSQAEGTSENLSRCHFKATARAVAASC